MSTTTLEMHHATGTAVVWYAITQYLLLYLRPRLSCPLLLILEPWSGEYPETTVKIPS